MTTGQATKRRSAGLSDEFTTRLLRFVSWKPGWDGDEATPVTVETATRALTIARSTLAVGPEPFVAPAADGSLLLVWDLPNADVELFVRGDDWEAAALTRGETVTEEPVHSVGDVVALLRRARRPGG